MSGIYRADTADPLPADARVLLLGRQGAGKSLMGRLLAARLDADFFSMGALLRSEQRTGSSLGIEIGLRIDRGEGVPPDASYGLLQTRLDERDRDRALILDGIPRLSDQAGRVREVLGGEPSAVIVLDLPTIIAVERIQNRTICIECDWPHGPGWPADEGCCSNCGGVLQPRVDDSQAGINQRYAIWGSESAEIVRYYEQLGVAHTVRADQAVRTVEQHIVEVLTSSR